MLPTGSGKTLIAAEVAAATVKARQTRASVLFMVPTRLLVEQQAKELRAETGLTVAEYMGGLAAPDPRGFDVLVALPAAYLKLCDGESDWCLSKYSLVVFDEVHHVMKKHPYRQVARRLEKVPTEHRARVLGLTASLTYAVGAGTLTRRWTTSGRYTSALRVSLPVLGIDYSMYFKIQTGMVQSRECIAPSSLA